MTEEIFLQDRDINTLFTRGIHYNFGIPNGRYLSHNTPVDSLLYVMREERSLMDEIMDAVMEESADSYKMERKNIKLDISQQKFHTILNTKDTTMCSICQDNFDKEDICSVLECGHIFHNKCINEWGMYKPQCAVCRREIKHDQCHA